MNAPVAIHYNKRISDLEPFDVLCGRNKISYNNIGNRRFRILINLNLPHYLECQSRNERSGMILSLTRDLCCCENDKSPSSSSCVRFFKLQKGGSSSSGDNNNRELIELDFKGCREKIGHALRDAASQYNNNNNNKSKEAIYETKKQQQKEGETMATMVPLTNLNSNYSENFFPNFDNNRNNNNTNNNAFPQNLLAASGAPRNSSRYSMEMLHGLREEAVPNISSLFFQATDDCKNNGNGYHQQQTNNLTDDGTNSLMSNIEPIGV